MELIVGLLAIVVIVALCVFAFPVLVAIGIVALVAGLAFVGWIFIAFLLALGEAAAHPQHENVNTSSSYCHYSAYGEHHCHQKVSEDTSLNRLRDDSQISRHFSLYKLSDGSTYRCTTVITYSGNNSYIDTSCN